MFIYLIIIHLRFSKSSINHSNIIVFAKKTLPVTRRCFYIDCTLRAILGYYKAGGDMDELTLREVCNTFGVSRRTVQGYEKAGLVSATSKNSQGYLLYDNDSLISSTFF